MFVDNIGNVNVYDYERNLLFWDIFVMNDTVIFYCS